MTMRAAIIGCGKRSAKFAEACVAVGDVTMVGFADPLDGAAAALAKQFGGKAFTDTAAMLKQTAPEFVCLVTRPSVRLEPIRLCAEAGVKALLSEKPMCTSWGEARAIHAAATAAGMALSFCHQRRRDPQFLEARRILEAGGIGEVRHIVAHCDNFYDWGTHWFDMMHYFNGETEAEWVIAQAQRVGPKYVFDQPMDRCGVAVVRFANGVTGTLQTGDAQAEGCRVRAIGDEGTLWVKDGGVLEVFGAAGKRTPTLDETAPRGLRAGVGHVIDCHRRGTPSTLNSRNALRATQLIFATYHSAMIGQRVPLPLPKDFDLSLTEVFGAGGPDAPATGGPPRA